MATTTRLHNVAPTARMFWEIVDVIGEGAESVIRARIADLPREPRDVYGFRKSDEDELIRAAALSIPPGITISVRSLTTQGRTRTNVVLGERLDRDSFVWLDGQPDQYSMSISGQESLTVDIAYQGYGSISVSVDAVSTLRTDHEERETRVLDRIESILAMYPLPAIPVPEPRPFRVVMGHGNDLQWRVLRDELRDQHGFTVDAFEGKPRAGQTISDILEEMAAQASVALVIMTKADAMLNGTWRARQNVVHEVGFFQGRLGWTNAIAVVEDGVDLFSNLDGTQQIRFPPGNIGAATGSVAATLHAKSRIGENVRP